MGEKASRRRTTLRLTQAQARLLERMRDGTRILTVTQWGATPPSRYLGEIFGPRVHATVFHGLVVGKLIAQVKYDVGGSEYAISATGREALRAARSTSAPDPTDGRPTEGG